MTLACEVQKKYLQVSVLAELVQDIAKGAMSGGSSVDVVGRQRKVVHAAQHLLQDDAILRAHAARVHDLQPIIFTLRSRLIVRAPSFPRSQE